MVVSDPYKIKLLTEFQSESCHAYVEGIDTGYGYVPSLAAGILFCVLFGFSFIAHIVQFSWKRVWWASLFAIGCATEILGWGARTWSAKCPYNSDAFLMQISTLIIAPVFFTAGIYVILGRLIHIAGPKSSVLSPAQYLWIFCTCDIISLVVQAIGGGMASSESSDGGDTSTGTNIMVAGIIFQLASITVFVACAADFLRRVGSQKTMEVVRRDMMLLVYATALSVVCIYIRSIYRTIELVQGWDGYLITTERFFIVLDAVMMIIAVGVYNVIHPGWFMPNSYDTVKLVLPTSQV